MVKERQFLETWLRSYFMCKFKAQPKSCVHYLFNYD